MSKQTAKVAPLFIRASLDKSTFDEANRTIEVVLATETLDVLRYDWRNDTLFVEQLVISPETVRLKRINAGAPFLDNHNSYGSVKISLGKVVEGSARISGDVIRCKLQFSKRKEVEDVFNDVRDGILTNISVGYKVFKYERQPIVDGETPIYRVIDWEPYEASLVLVAADIEAGVGRKKPDEAHATEVEIVDVEGETSERSANPEKNSQKTNKPLNNPEMDPLQKRALAVGLPTTATEAEVTAAERKLELTRRALAIGLKANATETEIEAAENKAKTDETERARKEVADAENKRAVEIIALTRKMKLPVEFGDRLIAEKKTIEEARALAIDELAKGDPNFRNNVTVTGKEEVQKRREAIAAALVIRSGAVDSKSITKEEREIAKDYRFMTLMDIAKTELERAEPGSTRGLDKMEIAARAITSHTSDFPVFLEGTNRRVLLAAYNAAPDKWREFCAIGSVGDFRDYKRVRPGSLTRLDALAENAEYKIKKIADGAQETVNVETFGNIINISRKMIVNDDIGAFTALAKALGRAAARGIEIDVFALLALNGGLGPVMADGKTLFHADHANIAGVAAAPSMVSFDAMATLFASMKDRQGNDYLDLSPALWLGPKSIEGTAKSINGSEYDPDATNKLQKPNIVKGMFKNTIGTPRMTGTRWYSFADPSEHPVLEVSFLDGQQAPFIESHAPFNVDGLSWKVRHDYGVDPVDYAGAGTNAGA